MKSKLVLAVLLYPILLFSQTVVTTVPEYPTQTNEITITFDVKNATHSNKIAGYSGDVYAHTGVTVKTGNAMPNRWQHVIGIWGENNVQPKLVRTGSDTYQITISNPRIFYGVNSNEIIVELCFVLRSSDGSKQTEDIFITLYEGSFSVIVNNPIVSNNFGDPLRSPVFVSANETLPISATTSKADGTTKSITLFINGIQRFQSLSNNLDYTFTANEHPTGKNEIIIIAEDITGIKDSSVFVIMKNPTIKNLPLPEGNEIGINIDSSGGITLALYAPKKDFIYVISNLTDWKVDTSFFMNKYEPKPDSVIWWIKLPLSFSEVIHLYSYQYLIDGKIRIPDPYSEYILDPWNDPDIPASVSPVIMQYPNGQTENIVSLIIVTSQNVLYYPYQWKIEKFNRPPKEKLIIYEMLIRDFVSTHSYKTLIDTLSYFKKLGINAIELMPVNEFEGNSSWGYNPMMCFAPDKYYGTRNDLKAFIDACHENGIAVIMDIVLNHAYGLNPMVRMYWDETNNRPSADNPWFNQVSPNPVFSWGYDFNHESKDTKYFVDRVTSFWLTEYKFDGFRFDFTKGFTNKTGDGSAYDASRIKILKRMADKIWEIDSSAYVILEHFAPDTEEKELTDYGMMVWGNLNYNYNEAAMGWTSNSNFSRISYKARGFTYPGLVGYMESHDEERLMYKNLQYGYSSESYNIKNLETALDRMKLAATFFIPVPGPKMIWQFGELGYDVSIDYNGRVGEKPIKWDYYYYADRKSLFYTYAGLNYLKTNYEAFSSGNFSLLASDAVKRLNITHDEMNITIVGNFGVTASNIAPNFQNAGKWFELFTCDSISVTDVNAFINLQPGEYKLYSSKNIPVFKDIITSIEEPIKELPLHFSLEQNYPNPFNSITTIKYSIPASLNPFKGGTLVLLKVYDVLGREVATLFNGEKLPGNYVVTFDASHSELGRGMASGVYFYRLQAGSFSQTKKFILMK